MITRCHLSNAGAFCNMQGEDDAYLAAKTVPAHWLTRLMILWSRMRIHCLGRLALPLLRGATSSRARAVPVTTHWTPASMHGQHSENKRLRRQFNEKPSIIPGCPECRIDDGVKTMQGTLPLLAADMFRAPGSSTKPMFVT